MKSSKILIIFSLLSLLVVSCSLERSNPLDPDAHDITAPLKVTGLTILEFSNMSVNLTWDAQIGIPTYYIYRSHTYDGLYIRVDTVHVTVVDSLSEPTISGEDFDDELLSGNWYAYKVSGVNDENLEGEPSNYKFTYYTDGNGKN